MLILYKIRSNSPIIDLLDGYISLSELSGIEVKKRLKIPNFLPDISVNILFTDLFQKADTYITEFKNNYNIRK